MTKLDVILDKTSSVLHTAKLFEPVQNLLYEPVPRTCPQPHGLKLTSSDYELFSYGADVSIAPVRLAKILCRFKKLARAVRHKLLVFEASHHIT
jgi:hypothetical protein